MAWRAILASVERSLLLPGRSRAKPPRVTCGPLPGVIISAYLQPQDGEDETSLRVFSTASRVSPVRF